MKETKKEQDTMGNISWGSETGQKRKILFKAVPEAHGQLFHIPEHKLFLASDTDWEKMVSDGLLVGNSFVLEDELGKKYTTTIVGAEVE